jgi:hypothetical protein
MPEGRENKEKRRRRDAGTPRAPKKKKTDVQLTSSTELGGADRYSHPNTTRPKSNRRNKIGVEKREDTIKVSAILFPSVRSLADVPQQGSVNKVEQGKGRNSRVKSSYPTGNADASAVKSRAD